MGMFDTVKVINIHDKKFKHNNVSYQTKSLECQGNDYIIFNDQLWMQYDGEENKMFSKAIPVNFSGELDIYSDYIYGDKTYWIEYSLSFLKGKLTGVEAIGKRLTKDRSDKSTMKPNPKSKSSCVTVDFRGTDGSIYESFHANLEDNLSKIRSVVGDEKTEIIYQVRSKDTGVLASSYDRVSWLHSVVQSLSDFESISSGKVSQKDSDGNSMTIFIDEANELLQKSE